MTIEAPLYGISDVVYLRESAALGHLEAVSISGISRRQTEWLYSISARAPGPTAVPFYGDRISAVQGSILQFTESEFVLLCDALDLAEANAQRQLAQIQAQQANLCTEPTAGT